MFHRIISASLSPNTEADDICMAISMLFRPWEWKRGKAVVEVIGWFEKRFPNFRAFAYNSGRSAMTEILLGFGIGKGDEVLVQSFTCVAVPNSVLWAKATPIYVDIDTSLNMDLCDAERKISKKTKAIIVQHTMGILGDLTAINAFAIRHKLKVIHDCAHSLGAMSKGKDVGLLGDAAFFSFGRDKVLSSVFGGIAIVKSDYAACVDWLISRSKTLPDAPTYWIFQQILHPIIFSVVLPLYTSGIGKILLWLFQKLSLVSFPVYALEKKSEKPPVFPSRYPNALAALLLRQLNKLKRYNAHRIEIAEYYQKALKYNTQVSFLTYPNGSIFLRFPIKIQYPEQVIQRAKKQGILLGNWYHNTIDPYGVDFTAIKYTIGSCPQAEEISTRILNLPTNISNDDAKRVVSFLEQ